MLDELRTTNHRERVRRLVALGRRVAAGDAGATDAVAELWAAGPWGRWLAVQVAYGDRDESRLLAALADSHESIRRVALRALLRLASDEGSSKALDGVRGLTATRVLLRTLARRRRAALADGWLTARLSSPDRAVVARHADLLPFGSAAAVEACLDGFRELAGPVGWRRLAAWHPAIAARELARLAATAEGDAWSRARFGAALDTLVSRTPDEAVAVARAAVAGGLLPPHLVRPLRLLARCRPGEVFDLLRPLADDEHRQRPPGPFGGITFDRHPERLGVERIAWLLAHAWHALPDGEQGRRWLRALSTADRRAVVDAWLERGRGGFGAFVLRELDPADPRRRPAFERWRVQARDATGLCLPAHLEWLPDDLRHEEARRSFGAPAIALEPDRRCAYAGLLPVSEGAERMAPWLRHPEGELRATALRAWLHAPALDPAGLGEVLRAVVARRYEQDPVRQVMLATLASLPLRIWAPGGTLAPETLDLLEQALQFAYEAADLSTATAFHAERLVCLLFRTAPAWGAESLGRALRLRGTISGTDLLGGMTKAEVRLLVPVLEDLARSWSARERWSAFTWLVSALGDHLPAFEGVTRQLGAIAREVPFAGHAAAALSLLQRHHPAAFPPVAEELFLADRSAVLLPAIAHWLGHHRQDLLDRVLGDEPMTGRWATGRTTWVVPFDGQFSWWSDRQRAALAGSLDRWLRDPELDLGSAFRAVNALVALPMIDPSAAIRVARAGEPPAVREVAVRGLGHVDGPEAVAELLEALGDERARVAIYALRRRFATMDDAEVLRALLAAPRARVTVAKEVARLLGELVVPEAHAALLELARQPQHRDVRVALLRALWSSIERDSTFEVFRAAAADPDPVLASRLAEVPAGQLSVTADRRMCELLAQVLARPEEEARRALLEALPHSPLRDPDRVLLAAVVARCSAPGAPEQQTATQAALLRVQPAEAPRLAAAIVGPPGDHRGFAVRVQVLRDLLGPWSSPGVRATAEQVWGQIRTDPLRVVDAVRLARPLTDSDGLGDLIEALRERDELHVDAMIAALEAVETCAHPERLEDRWRAHPDRRLRRLALAALVASAGPPEGWTPARLERLAAWQGDPDPGVAGPALGIHPPEEPGERG